MVSNVHRVFRLWTVTTFRRWVSRGDQVTPPQLLLASSLTLLYYSKTSKIPFQLSHPIHSYPSFLISHSYCSKFLPCRLSWESPTTNLDWVNPLPLSLFPAIMQKALISSMFRSWASLSHSSYGTLNSIAITFVAFSGHRTTYSIRLLWTAWGSCNLSLQ